MGDRFILLVEDNADDEALTLRALRKGNVGNRVIVVRDGVEAVDFLFCRGSYSNRDSYDLPQVVLLDLKMPKMDGLEVLAYIRKNPVTALLPVVILTSSKEERDIYASIKGGANSYVVKPVDMEQFTQAISQLGLYWFVLNEKATYSGGGKND